jgi:hypothetical protein
VKLWRRVAVEVVVSLAGILLLVWAVRSDAHWFERSSCDGCLQKVRDLARHQTMRGLAASVGVLLVLVLRPRAGRWIAAVPPGELPGACARMALALGLALVVSELILRWKWPAKSPSIIGVPPVRRSSVYGWEFLPSHTMPLDYSGRKISYAINAAGARARGETDEPDYAAPTILFVGESMVFGLGVLYEETYPALVGEDLGVQSANWGVIMYGGDQAYLRALNGLERFARPIAVVSIVHHDLVERNTADDRPRLRLDSSGLLEPVDPLPEWYRGLRLRALWQGVLRYRGEEALRIEGAVLRETIAAARARGAMALVVMTNYDLPCIRVEGEAPWLVRSLFAAGDVPHVQVDLDPSWRVAPADPHPDPRAHRKIAAAVEDALRGAHLAELRP